MEGFAASLGVFWIFLVIIGVLWLILPFAVFGIKDRLDQIIKLQRELLKAVTLNTSPRQGLLKESAEKSEPIGTSAEESKPIADMSTTENLIHTSRWSALEIAVKLEVSEVSVCLLYTSDAADE